ncbi:MAG: response regulator [Anaerolineae bacterium]
MPRILYIEDDENNRMLVKRILMVEGHTVDEADSASSGLAMALRNPPDLILMDLSMPGKDGLMATQEIRTHPSIAHIPIVALTANVREEDRERAKAAGCNGFITKPIDVDSFPEQIIEYLR